MAKSALRILSGTSKRRVNVAFAKGEAPITDEMVLHRMRIALHVSGDEQLLRLKIITREYNVLARTFVFEGEAQVMRKVA
jgi:hypothetical protein